MRYDDVISVLSNLKSHKHPKCAQTHFIFFIDFYVYSSIYSFHPDV